MAVAGLLAALRVTKSKMSDHTIVFQGAGEVGAELLSMCKFTPVFSAQKHGRLIAPNDIIRNNHRPTLEIPIPNH